ncbi:hypothetical protein HNR60_000618 [Rhodopseudomonas rhenobacensis]|uniref:Lectin-like protein BA14k n=1 Tax=Rhodopseudomonas rhenobacensis TaxID=87461 RepID=A0A7W7Z0W4_9BRAD|nr:BA14K family protein [Rhodopseudomonas rhenobacensis]MBB5045883.1 hypothetical protein [Rhodopseudomonas rhenobacensis]
MQYSKWLAAAMVVGATSFASVAPASAAPMVPNQLSGAAASDVQSVQYRGGYHRGGGWRGGPRYGYGHRGYGYGHRGYGYGAGAALGGLAAGAIIGGAIASSQAQAVDGNAEAYCSQRFKSYDPGSGTYLGYDGQRHSCP